MSDHEPVVLLCHFTIVPVCPVKFNVLTNPPLHIVWFELKVPPITAGFTVTVNAAEVSATQLPEVTTAR